MIHWYQEFGALNDCGLILFGLWQADCLQLIFLSYFSAVGMKPADFENLNNNNRYGKDINNSNSYVQYARLSS